jgi:sortase (surface protein transpeptidase)
VTPGKQSRFLTIAGQTLLGISLLIALFLIYQLFVTDFINSRSQAAAADELVVVLAERRDDLMTPGTTSPASTTTTLQVVELPELAVEPEVPVGEPFARLIIDRIALDAVVFEGVDRTTLKSGPGHMP